MAEEMPLVCARCARELFPGEGNFYEVRIESRADPSGPRVKAEDLNQDLRAQISALIHKMSDMSPSELMEQVYRRVSFPLCETCHSQWIEDPVGWTVS